MYFQIQWKGIAANNFLTSFSDAEFLFIFAQSTDGALTKIQNGTVPCYTQQQLV